MQRCVKSLDASRCSLSQCLVHLVHWQLAGFRFSVLHYRVGRLYTYYVGIARTSNIMTMQK